MKGKYVEKYSLEFEALQSLWKVSFEGIKFWSIFDN